MRRARTFIGIDDTDMPEEGGTGQVARAIARRLAADAGVVGVTRHQLLTDARVPCTRRNSCKVIHLADAPDSLEGLADAVEEMLVPMCVPGSDPGLCVSRRPGAEHPFGRRAQAEIVTQEDAHAAARDVGAVLRGLGGTRDGVIGAMAGVLLAAGGSDGRFVELGACREARGTLTVRAILDFGIDGVTTRDGRAVAEGTVFVPERGLRPDLRAGGAVLVVDPAGDGTWTVPAGRDHPGHGTGGRRWPKRP